MITVDCHEVESIQNELLIYVADNVAAIPNIKYHEFVLSPIEDDDVIDYFRKNNYDQGEILDVFLSQDFPNNKNAFHLRQVNPIMNNGTSL